MGLSQTEKGIDAIVLPQPSKEMVKFAFPVAAGARRSELLSAARRQLVDYMSGKRRSFDLQLDLSGGTDFQRAVWRSLRRVPYGRLRSYQWIAARVGGRRYARAVGNAVGANPIPIVIPCHRIVAHDGSLGGFSGGLPAKRKLLTLEGTLAQLKS